MPSHLRHGAHTQIHCSPRFARLGGPSWCFEGCSRSKVSQGEFASPLWSWPGLPDHLGAFLGQFRHRSILLAAISLPWMLTPACATSTQPVDVRFADLPYVIMGVLF